MLALSLGVLHCLAVLHTCLQQAYRCRLHGCFFVLGMGMLAFSAATQQSMDYLNKQYKVRHATHHAEHQQSVFYPGMPPCSCI